MSAGTNHTSFSLNRSAAARATFKWPRWMGSNVPPNSAIFIQLVAYSFRVRANQRKCRHGHCAILRVLRVPHSAQLEWVFSLSSDHPSAHEQPNHPRLIDRKSTRLNSSHLGISY